MDQEQFKENLRAFFQQAQVLEFALCHVKERPCDGLVINHFHALKGPFWASLGALGASPPDPATLQYMAWHTATSVNWAVATEDLDGLQSTIGKLEELLRLLPPSEKAPEAGGSNRGDAALNPPQCESEREIVETLRAEGHRLTTSKLLSAMTRDGLNPSESTVKKRLTEMVKGGRLTKDPKAKPPGYGLPEWGGGSSGSIGS